MGVRSRPRGERDWRAPPRGGNINNLLPTIRCYLDLLGGRQSLSQLIRAVTGWAASTNLAHHKTKSIQRLENRGRRGKFPLGTSAMEAASLSYSTPTPHPLYSNPPATPFHPPTPLSPCLPIPKPPTQQVVRKMAMKYHILVSLSLSLISLRFFKSNFYYPTELSSRNLWRERSPFCPRDWGDFDLVMSSLIWSRLSLSYNSYKGSPWEGAMYHHLNMLPTHIHRPGIYRKIHIARDSTEK